MEVYLYTFIILGFFFTLYIFFGDSKKPIPSFPLIFSVFISAFVIYQITYSGYVHGSDKWVYKNFFINITPHRIQEYKDEGFSYYTFLSRKLYSSSTLFFFQTAILYVLGYVTFAYKTINSKYAFLLIFLSFASLGFTSYGINTLRAGLALSMLLLAISLRKKVYLFILFAALAVLFHKSMVIPLFLFLITGLYNKPKTFIYIWLAAFVISAIGFSGITEFLQENIFSFDERPESYFDPQNETRYRTGFRWDFVIYSFVPILISSYYIFKLRLEDKFYYRLFGTYVLTNAVWLLVIRMAFTDRVAYLSWFLIPFLLLYPLLKYRLPLNQRIWVGVIITGMLTFKFILS